MFTVDTLKNRRKDRYLAESITDVKGTFRTKHPVKVLVLCVVVSDEKKMPYFTSVLEKRWVLMSTRRFLGTTYCHSSRPTTERATIWTQDGGPCYTAKKVQKFCKTNFADFWPADFCLSSSPDLNPLHCAVWGVLVQVTKKTSHSNISSLKATIEEEWAKMPKYFMVKRLSCVEAVIECHGSHIE